MPATENRRSARTQQFYLRSPHAERPMCDLAHISLGIWPCGRSGGHGGPATYLPGELRHPTPMRPSPFRVGFLHLRKRVSVTVKYTRHRLRLRQCSRPLTFRQTDALQMHRHSASHDPWSIQDSCDERRASCTVLCLDRSRRLKPQASSLRRHAASCMAS